MTEQNQIQRSELAEALFEFGASMTRLDNLNALIREVADNQREIETRCAVAIERCQTMRELCSRALAGEDIR